MIDALKWCLFEEYQSQKVEWKLASCPCCGAPEIKLDSEKMDDRYTFSCPQCGQTIYLTDVFRFHEVVDDEIGAGGILGYLTTTVEQMLIVHLIKVMMEVHPALLENSLIIKDGPLAFFGQTANLHKPMRRLMCHLKKNYDINMVGLEKSGSFVEHAEQIKDKLRPGDCLVLTNDYIYKYILPGAGNIAMPYGSSSYYSGKVIFKSMQGDLFVASVPTESASLTPSLDDMFNAKRVLIETAKLRCNLYYNSLIPVVLVNKLVSLADHPSSDLLTKFTKQLITK